MKAKKGVYPLIIGLTGSLGMGKSFTARMLKKLKIPVFESDHEVHTLLQHNKTVQDHIQRQFPRAVQTGVIDRVLLAEIVFKDPERLKQLEAIIHPFVFTAIETFIEKEAQKQQKLVILDIPLLFEVGYHLKCDEIIVVWSDERVRKERLLKRPGFKEEYYNDIVAQQMKDEEKKKRADFILETTFGKVHTFKQLLIILKAICQKHGLINA
jgi:dephospho-CoA kinase